MAETFFVWFVPSYSQLYINLHDKFDICIKLFSTIQKLRMGLNNNNKKSMKKMSLNTPLFPATRAT